jgi:hypothetical protein
MSSQNLITHDRGESSDILVASGDQVTTIEKEPIDQIVAQAESQEN